MSADQPSVFVTFGGEPAPKKRKATILDWISFYAYNLGRKPLVWKRKRELLRIADHIREVLNREVLVYLFRRLSTCPDCRNAYMALKPQIFVSQIEKILHQLKCEEHSEMFCTFLAKHGDEFDRSESLSAWINGFHK